MKYIIISHYYFLLKSSPCKNSSLICGLTKKQKQNKKNYVSHLNGLSSFVFLNDISCINSFFFSQSTLLEIGVDSTKSLRKVQGVG